MTEGAQSIVRALAILRSLAAGQDQGVRLIDIARNTGLSRPTAHRILRVLAEEGVVEQDRASRRYAVGREIGLLALARSQGSPLLRAAEPHLRRVAETLGDTVFLTIRTGLDTLCVARRLGSQPVQVLIIDVGARRAIGASSAGIAMLAALPEPEAADILARNADRLRAARTSAAQAEAMTQAARARGYVLRHRGLAPGTRAMSVCIPAGAHNPLAALTLAATDRRLTPQRVPEAAAVLAGAVQAIGQSLQRLPSPQALPGPAGGHTGSNPGSH